MKEKYILISFFLIITSVSISQEKNYVIKNFGSISVSSNLEIQNGDYKILQNTIEVELRKEAPYLQGSQNAIVFQQKGLNSFSNDAFSKFIRIIIRSQEDKNLNKIKAREPIKISQNEKDNFLKNQKIVAVESANQIGAIIKGQITAKTIKIGSYYYLRAKYLLYHEKFGEIDYSIHYLLNNGYKHIITTMFSVKDKTDFYKIINDALNSIVLN